MDAFAIESLTRAKRAMEDGSLRAEDRAGPVKTRKGESVVTDDEQPHEAALDKIPTLRPVFGPKARSPPPTPVQSPMGVRYY